MSIERFSEDVDLVLDREIFNFSENLNNSQIKSLRKKTHQFIATKFVEDLNKQFLSMGFKNVVAKCREVQNQDQDPSIVEIYYPKITEQESYIKAGIILEIGCRSLKEPNTQKPICSMVAVAFNDQPFADIPFAIPTVNPERTFLEKIFYCMKNSKKIIIKYEWNA